MKRSLPARLVVWGDGYCGNEDALGVVELLLETQVLTGETADQKQM
jgi:hypothetical protein